MTSSRVQTVSDQSARHLSADDFDDAPPARRAPAWLEPIGVLGVFAAVVLGAIFL